MKPDDSEWSQSHSLRDELHGATVAAPTCNATSEWVAQGTSSLRSMEAQSEFVVKLHKTFLYVPPILLPLGA